MGGSGFECLHQECMDEGRKGAVGVIRLGNWGGPLGAERGLWGGRGLIVCIKSVWMRAGRGRLV